MSFRLNIAYRKNEFPRLDENILLPLVQGIDSRISRVSVVRFDLANPVAFQLQNIATEDGVNIPDDTADKLESIIFKQAEIQKAKEKKR